MFYQPAHAFLLPEQRDGIGNPACLAEVMGHNDDGEEFAEPDDKVLIVSLEMGSSALHGSSSSRTSGFSASALAMHRRCCYSRR